MGSPERRNLRRLVSDTFKMFSSTGVKAKFILKQINTSNHVSQSFQGVVTERYDAASLGNRSSSDVATYPRTNKFPPKIVFSVFYFSHLPV